MRIALTAPTPQRPQDVVVSADDGAVVGEVAAALRGTSSPQAGSEWNWVRWLPHCAPQQGEECLALLPQRAR